MDLRLLVAPLPGFSGPALARLVSRRVRFRLADAVAVHSKAPTRWHGHRRFGPSRVPRQLWGRRSAAAGWGAKILYIFWSPRFSALFKQKPFPPPLYIEELVFSSMPLPLGEDQGEGAYPHRGTCFFAPPRVLLCHFAFVICHFALAASAHRSLTTEYPHYPTETVRTDPAHLCRIGDSTHITRWIAHTTCAPLFPPRPPFFARATHMQHNATSMQPNAT
jgi:hypothetical protein